MSGVVDVHDCIRIEKYARDKLERNYRCEFAALMAEHGVVKAWWDAGQPLPPSFVKHFRAHKLVNSGAVHDGSLAALPASARHRIAKFLCSTVRFVTDPDSKPENSCIASAELIIKETVALDNLDGSGIAVGIQVVVSDKQRVGGAYFFVERVPKKSFFEPESIRHLLVLPRHSILGRHYLDEDVELQLGSDGAARARCFAWIRFDDRGHLFVWHGIRDEDLAARLLAKTRV